MFFIAYPPGKIIEPIHPHVISRDRWPSGAVSKRGMKHRLISFLQKIFRCVMIAGFGGYALTAVRDLGSGFSAFYLINFSAVNDGKWMTVNNVAPVLEVDWV
ncbi:MAG: hypothetical protein VB032_06970 [Burkholderiaceae bacterium]|nr:hypothetical protein [Burkholderiaceae bacterium]